MEEHMHMVAEQRLLLGIDLIGSASNPGENLDRLAQVWRGILRNSLRRADIGEADILEWEDQGDDALLTLPHALLGNVVDMSQHLHDLAAEHNRYHRPEVRLRMAVLIGPVPAEPTYTRAKIDRARLLDAPAFRALIARCHRESEDGAHTGLIMSDHAFRTVFGGDHTALVRQAEFAEVSVAIKEFRDRAWVRVPGFDARSLRAFIADESVTEQEEDATPDGTQRIVDRTKGGVGAPRRRLGSGRSDTARPLYGHGQAVHSDGPHADGA
jgi:hypothetical protein